MSTLSPLGYKGTRDYYPEDKRVQNYIFSVWRRVVELYGYQEYGAPLLEPLDVYSAKSGQELANEQTYSFTDRGGRIVAIRPEMTPSISRMVAARRQELGYPARLYSIANFMRYERPQRGREREFWQLNADIFGVDGLDADVEILDLAHGIMSAFGASNDMYEIRVNNRTLINHIMSGYLGLDEAAAQLMVKLFDRKSKISAEEFTEQASSIFVPDRVETGIAHIQQLMNVKVAVDLPEELKDNDAFREMADLFEKLEFVGVGNVRFDITLMRGLDYYTGMVFEVFDLNPDNNRAMFGGGRYDGLVGLFGAEPIPTVGFAPGLTTTELFLRSHNLLPELKPTTDVGIIVVDESMKEALILAGQLRKQGINVEVDISGRKLDRQIKSSVKKEVPFILFIGTYEVQSQIYTLKNTATSSEEKLSFDQIIEKITSHR